MSALGNLFSAGFALISQPSLAAGSLRLLPELPAMYVGKREIVSGLAGKRKQ